MSKWKGDWRAINKTGIYKATGADNVTPSDLSDEHNRKPSKIGEPAQMSCRSWANGTKRGSRQNFIEIVRLFGIPRKIRNGHVHFCVSNDRVDSV